MECQRCERRLKLWSLFVSLVLSFVKAVIGILGSSESLVADGLYSLYQSFIIAKSTVRIPAIWTAGAVVGAFLSLGIIDVIIFSFVRINKAAAGLLVDPSPYAICVAVLSILANHIFYRYSICDKVRQTAEVMELTRSYKLSIVVSTIVLIGIALARNGLLYADAISALIVGLMLINPTVDLLRQSIRKIMASSVSGGQLAK